VLSTQLLIIVLKALSKAFSVGLPWEPSRRFVQRWEELLETVERLKCWKDAMKSKGIRVNMNKIKVICCKDRNG
jgi:hypothetical protein